MILTRVGNQKNNYQEHRLVFSRFLDLCENLGIVKEKPARKICFSREKKRLAPRVYQEKFCLVAFLWSQRNFYYIFTRNRCWNGWEYIWKGLITKLYKSFIMKALQKLYKKVTCLHAFKRTCSFFKDLV